MKKVVLILTLVLSFQKGFTQDCASREDKLFELINNFSSAYLFNTYGLIGGIVDGHTANAYEDETVTDLLNAQKKLATDMASLITNKINEDSLITGRRKDYLKSFSEILMGFNEQIDLYFRVMKNDSKKNKDAYVTNRKKSWKDISDLLGMKED